MMYTIRVWGSRIFAVCFILLATLVSNEMESRRHQRPAYSPVMVSFAAASVSAPKAVKPPITRRKRIKPPTSSVLCLAQNLYFEAATEPEAGIAAVAATVFNRIASKYYPQSICAVVYQPFQYSWTVKVSNWNRTPPKAFMTLAKQFIRDRDILREDYPVTHFHRIDITPKWASTMTYVSTFGQHIFYSM